MHPESITPAEVVIPRSGVLVLTGYGIRVAVKRGHLMVSDGRGRERREGRFPRTTRDLKRLVIIGHTGTVSFDALRWLHDIGCAFVQIDSDGQIMTSSGPAGLNDARLRRAQALAAGNDTGLAISRDLLTAKLDGQANLLDRVEGAASAASAVRGLRDGLATTTTLDGLRFGESQAARIYWDAWALQPVNFARKAVARVPEHWKTVGTRHSPLTRSPRAAVNPANAILNYLYAIAEAECRIALLAVGLDPGMGIVHADQRNRDSFACDVMEAVRPAVDTFALELLRTRPFGAADFFETRQGGCRLMPSITRLLADTAPRWTLALAPVVEEIARTLWSDEGLRLDRKSQTQPAQQPLPTPLTQTNRSAGRANLRKQSTGIAPSRRTATIPAACQDCGVVLEDSARSYCDDCLPEVRLERARTFALTGPATLMERRAAGADPAHGGSAGKARGRSNATHHASVVRWEREHRAGSDAYAQAEPEHFTRDILPTLRNVALRAMADATGLTQGYCSFVRRGLKVPHRRHWEALARLIEEQIR